MGKYLLSNTGMDAVASGMGRADKCMRRCNSMILMKHCRTGRVELMTLFFTFSQDMSKNMALYLLLLPNQDIAAGFADYTIDCFCSCWRSLKHGLEMLLMQEKRIKASSCSHGSVDSALFFVFRLSLMQLQIALSNIIAI